MSALVQPYLDASIDWSNPITQGLRFSAYNSALDYVAGPRDYVTRRTPRSNSSVGYVTSAQRSITPLFDGIASAAVALPNLAGVQRFTMSFWLWWNTYSNGSGKFAFKYCPDSGSQDTGEFFVLPDDSSGLFTLAATSGPSNQAAFKFTRPSAAAWHFYDLVVDLTQSTLPLTSVQVDGVAVSNSGGVSTFGGPTSLAAYAMSIMCTPPGTPTLFSAGRVANVNIWSRILTSAERLSMYRNALQVLRARPLARVRIRASSPASATARWFLM